VHLKNHEPLDVGRALAQHDRRRVGVVITEAGRQLLESITARRRAWMAERLTALTPEQRAAVEAAVAALDQITGERKVRRRVEAAEAGSD